MTNTSITERMLQLAVYGEGSPMEGEVRIAVSGLFTSAYYSYHYLEDLCKPSRFRVVALERATGRIVGFGSLERMGAFAYMSNLLVDARLRGGGIGAEIDGRRMELAAELGLCPCASCVTVGTSSQRLKESLGLRPINIKLGYRRGVFSATDVSSAVTYLGRLAGPIEPLRIEEARVDVRNRRARHLICSRAAIDQVLAQSDTSFYIDILCPVELTSSLNALPALRCVGVDIDLPSGSWGVLYQLRNAREREGLCGSLDLVRPLAESTDAIRGMSYLFGEEFAHD